MATNVIVETISLDTQVFVATGFGFNGRSFKALRKHLASGRLQLVMTDITVREVRARINLCVADELVKHREFTNEASALFNSSLPNVQIALKKLDPDVVAKDLCDQFDAFLRETKATIIDTKNLNVGDVLNKYFAGAPPFGNAETKKHEFPDAFAIQALAEFAESRDIPIFVVSKDKLFQEACVASPRLLPKKVINDVLDHVASDDQQLATFLRNETMKRIVEITAKAKEEFEDRFYWVEDEGGDAEVRITELLSASEPKIITIDKNEATLQLSMAAEYKAYLSYDDSATASYDEGDLVYVEHRDEEVERDEELIVEIETTYEQMDPGSFEISNILLIQPSDGFGIETQDNYDWPYK